jgi:hypothetical protein
MQLAENQLLILSSFTEEQARDLVADIRSIKLPCEGFEELKKLFNQGPGIALTCNVNRIREIAQQKPKNTIYILYDGQIIFGNNYELLTEDDIVTMYPHVSILSLRDTFDQLTENKIHDELSNYSMGDSVRQEIISIVTTTKNFVFINIQFINQYDQLLAMQE